MKAGGSRKQQLTTMIGLRLLELGFSFNRAKTWRSEAHKKLNTKKCEALLTDLRMASLDKEAWNVLLQYITVKEQTKESK